MRLFLYLSFFCIGLYGEALHWQFNFDEAHHMAAKGGKPLMVLLVDNKKDDATRMLLKESFTNQPYIDRLNKEFVSVLIFKNQKSSYPIELLYTTEYPSLFFLNHLEVFMCEPIYAHITPQRVQKHLLECGF